MLGTSETVSRDLVLTQRAAIRPYRNHKRSDECRIKKAKQNQLNYRKRKAAGICAYGHCPAKTELGHTHCQRHLRAMAERAGSRRNERIAQGLCIYCGERQRFWGRKCIICRQLFAKDPLPSGAKRALRRYREAEMRGVIERMQRETRAAALKLLASKGVEGKYAQALRLYVGLDDAKWRTYREVAKRMNISVERVRQLLMPSKVALTTRLSGRVPWRPLGQDEPNDEDKNRGSASTACTRCKDIALKIVDPESYLYEGCGLPNVFLFGLLVDHCQVCQSEVVLIPSISDLHIELAKAVLLKPTALTGEDLRFLKTVAGLSTVAFAEHLGIAIQTGQSWLKSDALRYLNDLGTRVVLAALIAPGEDWSPIFEMVSSLKLLGTQPSRVTASWSNEEAQWAIT